MSFASRLASLHRNLFAKSLVERDLDAELRGYVDELAEQKRRQGLNPEEARRAALVEFGGLEQVKEEVRETHAGHLVEEFFQDLRYGARTLRRNPAFTAIAVLAVALGIGANTTMFSVAYGMLLRPLPYNDADRLAVVSMRFFPRDAAFGTMCVRDFLIWRDANRAFEEPALYEPIHMDVGGDGNVPEQVQGASVTARFFPTLRVQPLIGRTFSIGDDAPNGPSFTVLGETLWRRRFGASASVLGRTIMVAGVPSTVVGVMPSSFRLPRRDTELWTTLPLNPPSRFGPWFYRGIARLKPGVTIEQAQAETNVIAKRMMRQNQFYKRVSLPVTPLRDSLLGTQMKPAVLVLAGAVVLVLLIAVVNVANLMLARASVRDREMAMRLSLGARRGRLMRQLITESVLLAALGGAGGLALSWGGIGLIRVWNPGNLPLIDSVRLDWTALGFMLLASLVTGVLFGLVPALACARVDINSTLKECGRTGSASASRGRTRAMLVVSEIAFSLMLLVGAGLLLRSFSRLQQVSAGMSTPPERILTIFISPGSRKFEDPAAGLPFYDEVLRHARSVPGVETAAITDTLPPDRQGDADSFVLEGQTLAPGQLNPITTDATVSPDYFRVLGVPLLKGRFFTNADQQHSTAVTIVSEAFAKRYFPGREVLGKHVKLSGPGFPNPWMQIVGVVGNAKYMGLTMDTDPALYMPIPQNYGPQLFLAVKTSGEASAVAETARRAVQAVDANATLAQIGTMDQDFHLTMAQPRFDTMLLSLFAGIALALAAVGIYGLIAYSVVQRTHEIGIRMALGAARGDVVRMVLRQGASLAGMGIILGLAGAFAFTGLLRSLLFGVGVTDAIAFAVAPLGMLLVILAATSLPALRAARISPVISLRCE